MKKLCIKCGKETDISLLSYDMCYKCVSETIQLSVEEERQIIKKKKILDLAEKIYIKHSNYSPANAYESASEWIEFREKEERENV